MRVEWSQGQDAATAVEVWQLQALLDAVLDAVLADTDEVARAMAALGLLRPGVTHVDDDRLEEPR